MGKLMMVFLAALMGIIIDVLTKKASDSGSVVKTVFHPLMVPIYILCVAQIVFGSCAFVWKWDLAVYSNLYVIFFAVMSVLFGYLFFSETLTMKQWLGIAMGMFGAFLLYSK
jgi:drug/metabolite transporter (DMT)-like permease